MVPFWQDQNYNTVSGDVLLKNKNNKNQNHNCRKYKKLKSPQIYTKWLVNTRFLSSYCHFQKLSKSPVAHLGQAAELCLKKAFKFLSLARVVSRRFFQDSHLRKCV